MADDQEEEEGEEEDGNTSLDLIIEYNRYNGAKRFYQSVVELCLFLFTIDPFAIYKGSTYRHSSAARFEIYQTKPLRIELNHIDRKFKRWRMIVRRSASFFFIKFSAIILVQVVLRTSRLSPTSQEAEDSSRLLEILSQILGNPLSDLPGVTLFVFGLLGVGIAYTELYLFQYYTIEPFNSVQFRLWLEPVREFKRIDIIIRQTLENLGLPFERSCHCTAGSKRRKYSGMGPDCGLLESREIQVKIVDLFRRRYWYLRPIIYTIDWYKSFNRCTVYVTVPILVAIILFLLGILEPLIRFVFASRTSGGLGLDHLNFYQFITVGEVTFISAFVLPMCLIELVLFLSICLSQLILLNDVKYDLQACLAELRLMNCGRVVDSIAAICIILRPLIKTYHSLDELRNNTKFLTQMVAINIVISSTSCIFILLAEFLDGENLADFRFVIIGFHWAWTNAILVCCAYIYARSLKLETITWSMMAELRTKETRDNWILFEFQVAELWRRLIMSRCFSEFRMSVRPFGMTLTYDRGLQLNFLAISLAGLLKSF